MLFQCTVYFWKTSMLYLPLEPFQKKGNIMHSEEDMGKVSKLFSLWVPFAPTNSK